MPYYGYGYPYSYGYSQASPYSYAYASPYSYRESGNNLFLIIINFLKSF